MIWLFSTQGTSASVLLRHCAGEHRTVAEQLLWVPIQLSAWYLVNLTKHMQKVYALSELHSEKNLELATRLHHHCPPFFTALSPLITSAVLVPPVRDEPP